jgi:hypothetical protein
MSDGLSEGASWAREHDARQATIDAFFGMVIGRVTGEKVGAKEFRKAFDAFDAHRYADNIASHRIAKGRGERWEAFLATLDRASARGRVGGARLQAWAEIFSLALRFASSSCVQAMQAATPFKEYRIALVVPNGTGFHGRNQSSLLGDFEGVLDAIAERPGSGVVLIVEDRERAVVALTAGEGRSEEKREEERSRLRFLAARNP